MASSVGRDGIEYISYQYNPKANLHASISTEKHNQGRHIHLHATTTHTTHAITRQVPSTEIRVRAMGREPIAAHCAEVQHCVGALSTCSEVGLALRAIWTTSWLAEPNC